MAGRVTTHVLDLSKGIPAVGVLVEFWEVVSDNEFTLIQACYTNEDGRVSKPLLEGSTMKKGTYELRFHVGDYYHERGGLPGEPAFLNCVPIRFGISEPGDHYHVPLLLSPGGYSTYRGS
jgi:5-hydroxyisourate hydrolase